MLPSAETARSVAEQGSGGASAPTIRRSLIRAGVPRGVAMQIAGHKTEAIFERYNITDAADVRDVLVKVGTYSQAMQRKAEA